MRKAATASIVDIAHDLIGRDLELDPQHETSLFWHGKPFYGRWRLEAGTVNLKPFKKLERRVDVCGADGSPEADRSTFARFIELYPQVGSTAGAGNVEIYEIFMGQSVKVHSARQGTDRRDRVLTIEHDLGLSVAPRTTTADLGHMMLVDELLWEQGFRAERIMAIQDALDVQRLVS